MSNININTDNETIEKMKTRLEEETEMRKNIIFMEEAQQLIGVGSRSAAYTFIRKHNVKTGTITMKGKPRKVVLKSSLEEAVRRQGYDGSYDVNDIVWSN